MLKFYKFNTLHCTC